MTTLTLDSFVRVHVCAQNDEQLAKGARLFKSVLTAGNITQKNGFWRQYDELALVVEHWFSSDTDNTRTFRRLLRALAIWQVYASQEAISLEIQTPDNPWRAYVYETPEDLAELWANVLAPAADRGTYLANYFSK